MEVETSPECQPVTAGALLSRIYSENTAGVCSLCLCEDSHLTPSVNVYLKDDYTDVNISLEQLVNELQFDKIINQHLLKNICESCTQQLSLFYLFKRKCFKLASGLSNFYKLVQITKDDCTVFLPFETIEEYAVEDEANARFKLPLNHKNETQKQLINTVVDDDNLFTSCSQDIGQKSTKDRADTNDCEKIKNKNTVAVRTPEHITSISNTNLNIKLTDSELEKYIGLVAEFIVHRKSFCSCCLKENEELFDMTDPALYPDGQKEIIPFNEMLSAINFGNILRIEPALICQDCINVIVSTYNFKTTFEKSMSVIRNCVTGLETCLDNTKRTRGKIKVQILNLYAYLNKLIPTQHTTVARTMKVQERTRTKTESLKANSGKKVDLKSVYKKVPKRKYKCKICGTTVSTMLKAKIHKLEHCIPEIVKTKIPATDNTMEPSVEPTTACHLCGHEFSTFSKLQLHIVTKHNDHLNCSYCNKAFRSRSLLKRHTEKCKKIKRYFECDICHLKHTRRHMADTHRLRHFPKTIKCEFCDLMLWSTRDLNLHQSRMHRELLNKSYECSICHSAFTRMRAMRAHMLTHPPGSKHTCKYCGASYRNRVSLNGHCCPGKVMSMKKSNINDIDVKVKNGNNVENNVKQSSNSSFCDMSGLVLKSPTNLESTRATHQEVTKDICKSAMCDLCGQLFKNGKTLSRHQQSCKSQIQKEKQSVAVKVIKRGSTGRTYKVYYNKYLECNYCNYKTLNKLSYELHLNKHHFKIRPYQCSVCDKTFHTKPALARHVKIHLEITDQSLQCKECGKLFKYKKTLMYHTRLHTGEQPYPCDLCDERFINASRRQSHRMRKHFEPAIQCSICLRFYHFEHDLNYHIRKTHSGEPKKPGASKKKLQKIKF